jgi:methionyl-tRNA synthetase
MIAKNCDARVPQPQPLNGDDTAILAAAAGVLDTVREEFGRQAFHRGLEAIWKVVGDANRYVDAQAPWALRKTDPERMATVLYVLTDVIRRLAILIQPIMPDAASSMLDQLSVPADRRSFNALGGDHAVAPGTELPQPSPVFPRYVEAETAA